MKSYTITKKDAAKYKEIRGVIKRKKRVFGKYYFYISISDGEKEVKINVGEGLFNMPQYPVGAKVTAGYSGRKLINIRPGIVKNDD